MNRSAPSSTGISCASEVSLVAAACRRSPPLFLTGAAAMWAGAHTHQNVALTLAYTLFVYLLALLATADLRHGILPHILTLTLSVLGVILAPTLGLTYTQSIAGALTAFFGLFACALVAEKWAGKPALGGGDLWLVMGLGAWVGLAGLPMLLVATTFTGVLSLWIKRWLSQNLLTYAGEAQTFPFGPALCLAGWLTLLFWPWYWRFMEMVIATAV